MAITGTTRLSEKGQVVIPRAVREKLGLTKGADFVVVAQDDIIVLKRLEPPSIAEFDAVIGQLRRQARRAGIRAADVQDAVESVRARE